MQQQQQQQHHQQHQQQQQQQDHHSIIAHNPGHLHHTLGGQNDLKLGLGMGVGVGGGLGGNLGMMSALDKSNHDLLKAVTKVNS